jgi:hypothetical protein
VNLVFARPLPALGDHQDRPYSGRETLACKPLQKGAIMKKYFVSPFALLIFLNAFSPVYADALPSTRARRATGRKTTSG